MPECDQRPTDHRAPISPVSRTRRGGLDEVRRVAPVHPKIIPTAVIVAHIEGMVSSAVVLSSLAPGQNKATATPEMPRPSYRHVNADCATSLTSMRRKEGPSSKCGRRKCQKDPQSFVEVLSRRPGSTAVREFTMHPRREGPGEALQRNFIFDAHRQYHQIRPKVAFRHSPRSVREGLKTHDARTDFARTTVPSR